MFILKLAFALIITVVALVLVFRYQKQIKGDSDLGLKAGGAKEQASNPHELEEFIAAYRRDKALGIATAVSPPSAPSPTPTPAPPSPPAASAASAASLVASATASPPAALKARSAFLAGPSKLAFLVLKAGLPDHHVFANTRLADVVDGNLVAALSNLKIDLLVCGKDLGIVAAVDLGNGGQPPSVLDREKQLRLEALGIRYVRLEPGAFPKPADVRRTIYGSE
jgi:hypothetical protein